MIFKMYNSDFGFKYNGVDYRFDHVESFTIEDPESTKLVRGANAQNKMGLVYKEGSKEPKRLTVTVIGMTADIYAVLKNIYVKKERLDPYAIDRADGSSKIGRNAILCTEPQQLMIDESAESMNVALIFESFDFDEVHKS